MKHGTALILLGLTLIVTTWEKLPWSIPVVWLGVDFLVVGLGHFRPQINVSGKQLDGRIPLWSKFLFLPYNLFLYVVWLLSAKVFSSEDAVNQVNDDLFVARRLDTNEVPPNLTAYVDLTSELEDPSALRAKDNYICLPILDASVPSLEELQSLLERIPDGPTLVHCAQGHGRTGTIAIAILADRSLVTSLEEGLQVVQKVRPGITLNTRQKSLLQKYFNGLASNNKSDGSQQVGPVL